MKNTLLCVPGVVDHELSGSLWPLLRILRAISANRLVAPQRSRLP
jgi:hypothetical protein